MSPLKPPEATPSQELNACGMIAFIRSCPQKLGDVVEKQLPGQNEESSPLLNDGPLVPFDEDEGEHLTFSCPVDHSGSAVFVQGWAGVHSPYNPVILVHDLGESSDFYASSARLLANHGFSAYCFDMRGHGRSSSLSDKSVGFQDYVKDLLQVVAWIRYKSQRKRPYLIGQGVGALVVLHFLKLYPQYATRSVLLAPTFEEQSALPFFSRLFLKSMAQLVPSLALPTTLLPYFLPMSDEASQRASSLACSARFAYDLREAVRDAAHTFTEVSSSCLVCSPVDDTTYNHDHLRRLIQSHPEAHSIAYREINGIDTTALCSNPGDLARLMEVVVPWLQEEDEAPSA